MICIPVIMAAAALAVTADTRNIDDDCSVLIANLERRFEAVTDYRCRYRAHTTDGKKTMTVTYRYYFKKPKWIRMEVLDGKYRGAVLCYKPHRVRLRLGGAFLSRFPMSFDPGHPWVRDVRGRRVDESHWGWLIERHAQAQGLFRCRAGGRENINGRAARSYTIESLDYRKTSGIAREDIWVTDDYIMVKNIFYGPDGAVVHTSDFTEITINGGLDDRLFSPDQGD